MNKELISRIIIDPKVMSGKPVIKGTRVPIVLILKMLSQDISIDEIIAEYPRLCSEASPTTKRLMVKKIFKLKIPFRGAALLYGSIVISEPVLPLRVEAIA